MLLKFELIYKERGEHVRWPKSSRGGGNLSSCEWYARAGAVLKWAITLEGLKLTFLALPCSSPDTAGWLLNPCFTFNAVNSSWNTFSEEKWYFSCDVSGIIWDPRPLRKSGCVVDWFCRHDVNINNNKNIFFNYYWGNIKSHFFHLHQQITSGYCWIWTNRDTSARPNSSLKTQQIIYSLLVIKISFEGLVIRKNKPYGY